MRSELRSVHALDGSNSIAEITGMGYEKRVFENIGSSPQIIKEKICAGIFCSFIIT